jgi:hypothetical protein
MTACLYEAQPGHVEYQRNGTEFYYRKEDNEGCLRPCHLLARSEGSGTFFYVARVENITNKVAPDGCVLPLKENNTVYNLPQEAVFLVDKEYTSDEHLPNSFRHEIGVPDDMYPDQWKVANQKDPTPLGDFVRPPRLQPGELSHVYWQEDNTVVTPNAYLLRTPPQLREELLSYATRVGITALFQNLVVRGNELPPGEEDYVRLNNGHTWFLQRPPDHWRSNMHWISPSDAASQNDYLQALSSAGFDDMLSKIGDYFGFNGIACYHLTFIAVTRCSKGYLHHDLSETAKAETESRAFNMIIPLLLTNETGPELELASYEDSNDVGRYRYEYDVATLVSSPGFSSTGT